MTDLKSLKPAPRKPLETVDKPKTKGIAESVSGEEMDDGLTHLTQNRVTEGGPITLDLLEIERLAALGLNKASIAKGLAVSRSTFNRRMVDNQEVADAYDRGFFQLQIRAGENMKKHADKNFIATIFQTKNVLGWRDDRNQKIQVEHTLSRQEIDRRREAAFKKLEQNQGEGDPPVIELFPNRDYKEIEK